MSEDSEVDTDSVDSGVLRDVDESSFSDDSEWSEEQAIVDDNGSRTLLWLCEEGQLDVALQRVKEWDRLCPIDVCEQWKSNKKSIVDANSSAFVSAEIKNVSSTEEEKIQRELFRKSPTTGNFCLHEILAGGICGKSAPELVKRLVQRYQSYSGSEAVFSAQPRGSSGRTVLHWCAWGNTTPQILRMVMEVFPEALCLRDNHTHGSRTPLEIAKRYWEEEPIMEVLQQSMKSYLPHRLRSCLRLCVRRHFLHPESKDSKVANDQKSSTASYMSSETVFQIRSSRVPSRSKQNLTPFEKADRRNAGLTPRAWFVASILGYTVQREMKGLENQILSFVGYGARIANPKRSKRKKRK